MNELPRIRPASAPDRVPGETSGTTIKPDVPGPPGRIDESVKMRQAVASAQPRSVREYTCAEHQERVTEISLEDRLALVAVKARYQEMESEIGALASGEHGVVRARNLSHRISELDARINGRSICPERPDPPRTELQKQRLMDEERIKDAFHLTEGQSIRDLRKDESVTSSFSIYRLTAAGGNRTGDWMFNEKDFAQFVDPQTGKFEESKYRAWAAIIKNFQNEPICEIHVMDLHPGDRFDRLEGTVGAQRWGIGEETDARLGQVGAAHEPQSGIYQMGGSQQVHVLEAPFHRMRTVCFGTREADELLQQIATRHRSGTLLREEHR